MAYVALEQLINLQDGYRRAFRLPFAEVLLIQTSGERYLIDRYCPHAGQTLDTAEVRGDTLVCPKHGLCFALSDGAVIQATGKALRVFRLAYEGNTIGVDV